MLIRSRSVLGLAESGSSGGVEPGTRGHVTRDCPDSAQEEEGRESPVETQFYTTILGC